jgi:hypothetical protein
VTAIFDVADVRVRTRCGKRSCASEERVVVADPDQDRRVRQTMRMGKDIVLGELRRIVERIAYRVIFLREGLKDRRRGNCDSTIARRTSLSAASRAPYPPIDWPINASRASLRRDDRAEKRGEIDLQDAESVFTRRARVVV